LRRLGLILGRRQRIVGWRGLGGLSISRIGEEDRKQNLRYRQFLLHNSRGLCALLHQHLIGRWGKRNLRAGARDRVKHDAGHGIRHVVSSAAAVRIFKQRGGQPVDIAGDVRVQIRADGRAANAQRRDRGGNLHVAGVGNLTCDESEGALNQADDGRIRRAVAIVGEFRQHHAGTGPHVERGTVDQAEREAGAFTGHHHVALEKRITGFDDVNDAIRVLDAGASTGKLNAADDLRPGWCAGLRILAGRMWPREPFHEVGRHDCAVGRYQIAMLLQAEIIDQDELLSPVGQD
jgi:hypothetical protein